LINEQFRDKEKEDRSNLQEIDMHIWQSICVSLLINS